MKPFGYTRRGSVVSTMTMGMVSVLALIAGASAQTAAPNENSVKTFFLKNTTQQNDANEIMVALRNMLDPHDKIYLVNNESAILIAAPPEQIELAQRLISELDRPRKQYRLTYTLTEMDGDKRSGVNHISMMVAGGQRTTLKQGNKVPVATGSFDSGSSKAETQFTYLDVGLNFDATVDEFGGGLKLRSKVERSSVAASALGPQDPMVRQTVIEGTASILPGKSIVLGSFDIPDTTHHLEIAVVAEPVS